MVNHSTLIFSLLVGLFVHLPATMMPAVSEDDSVPIPLTYIPHEPKNIAGVETTQFSSATIKNLFHQESNDTKSNFPHTKNTSEATFQQDILIGSNVQEQMNSTGIEPSVPIDQYLSTNKGSKEINRVLNTNPLQDQSGSNNIASTVSLKYDAEQDQGGRTKPLNNNDNNKQFRTLDGPERHKYPYYPSYNDTERTDHFFDARKSSLADRKGTEVSTSFYVSDVFCSSSAVDQSADGFTDKDFQLWRRKAANFPIVNMEEGCGSMQNRLVTFNDSTKACVRYRFNTELMQGEIYSHFLGRVLGMNYSPPTTLLSVDLNSAQWQGVASDIKLAKWSENKLIVISKWIEDLIPVFLPKELRDNDKKLHPTKDLFLKQAREEICDHIQWSDLIIFDYLLANPDRVVNNIVNKQWNDKMMYKPVHNLEKSKRTGIFVFLDNESGLFHGYRLLERYESYLKGLLDSVCVFRKSTVDAIERLYKSGDVGESVQSELQKYEPLYNMLPRIPHRNKEILQIRLMDVYKQIQKCKSVYSG
ncbi:hypothetical protein CHS0354_018823 [Potamilus streckersoni]|uniref:Uncharacterized protein n=1 Tax=Potamilus streckersoni TaxID=2493646 RepID=A0AAE0SEU1_9BIVA|nr:hypothetical protein CHS0354_018823 [Potamilus streckersoni]